MQFQYCIYTYSALLFVPNTRRHLFAPLKLCFPIKKILSKYFIVNMQTFVSKLQYFSVFFPSFDGIAFNYQFLKKRRLAKVNISWLDANGSSLMSLKIKLHEKNTRTIFLDDQENFLSSLLPLIKLE